VRRGDGPAEPPADRRCDALRLGAGRTGPRVLDEEFVGPVSPGRPAPSRAGPQPRPRAPSPVRASAPPARHALRPADLLERRLLPAGPEGPGDAAEDRDTRENQEQAACSAVVEVDLAQFGPEARCLEERGGGRVAQEVRPRVPVLTGGVASGANAEPQWTSSCSRLSIVMGQNPMIRPASCARPASRPATLAHLCTRASAPVNENMTATLRAVTAPPGAALPARVGPDHSRSSTEPAVPVVRVQRDLTASDDANTTLRHEVALLRGSDA